MLNPGYVPFRWLASRWIRQALAGGEHFDVAHQVAPVSLRYASPLVDSGVPYVVGPVGGGLTSPAAFREEEGAAPWFTSLRSVDGFRLRYDRRLRRSFAQASCVLGIADYVRDLLRTVQIRDFQVLSDVGVEAVPEIARGSDRTQGVRFLYVGRIVRNKGVRDAVRAIGRLPRGLATLDVVGEGYDRPVCEDLAAELGVADLVRFRGRLAHEEVLKQYETADAFLFPSYREAGGIVVVEAMSYGLPVIVCDAGGPASTVSDGSGFRVPAVDPDQYASALAEAMILLSGDPGLRQAMGAAGRQRIADIGLWDSRIRFVEDLYKQVIEESAPR